MNDWIKAFMTTNGYLKHLASSCTVLNKLGTELREGRQVSLVALGTEKECRLVRGITLQELRLGGRQLGILELGGLEKKNAEN